MCYYYFFILVLFKYKIFDIQIFKSFTEDNNPKIIKSKKGTHIQSEKAVNCKGIKSDNQIRLYQIKKICRQYPGFHLHIVWDIL